MRPIALKTQSFQLSVIVISITVLLQIHWSAAYAHHVLGRPSYSLSEDSTTPPAMQVETQIGKYFVTYMAFPAFPKANESGRVNLYVRKIADDTPYTGEVTFYVKDDSWFSSKQEKIGQQQPDDNVYRQGFVFKENGQYIIRASFHADGEPYDIDFPLQIGSSSPFGLLGGLVILLIITVIAGNLLIHKKIARRKIKQHQQELNQS